MLIRRWKTNLFDTKLKVKNLLNTIILDSTNSDSKYEGPWNSTDSLTFAFKSSKPKR